MNVSSAADRYKRPVLITALCFLVSILEGYDMQVVAAAGPVLRQELDIEPAQLGLVFGSSQIGLAIGAVIGGLLADRMGRKPILIWSVLLLGFFTFITAFSTSAEQMIAFRILTGIGLGGAMPTLIALMAEIWGRARMTSVVTAMLCCQPVGGVLAGVAGRGILPAFGWEGMFVLGGALTVATVPLLMLMLPGSRPETSDVPQPQAGGGRLSVMETIFGDGRGVSSVLMWVIFTTTLALLAIVVSWTPLLAISQGLSQSTGLNAIIILNLGSVVGGVVVGRLIDRFGVRWPLTILFGLMAISLYVFATIGDATTLLVTSSIVGATVLGAQFALYGVLPRLYPAAGRGSGVGFTLSIGRLGSLLGPVAIGALIAGGATVPEAFRMLVPVAIAAGVLLFALTFTAQRSLQATED